MERLVTSNLKLGIIAGGQLGKMLIQEASKWDIITYILDQDVECPARSIASHFIQGSNLDYDDVYRFGKMVDVLTFEIENINIDALKRLKAEGVVVKPDPDILELIQDKGLQKEFYLRNHIPTSPFRLTDSATLVNQLNSSGPGHRSPATTPDQPAPFSFPFVQKLRKGGYDGRGVAVIDSSDDLGKLLEGASVIEEKVDIAKEISVIVARNKKGEVRCFPVVEMTFDPQANLVDKLLCPAVIPAEQAAEAQQLATRIIESLKMEGLLAVEFFIDRQNRVIVNEIAPRPHNSGHHTIESIVTSQFEQHLRAILELPLGSTCLKLPSVMINILGAEGHEGPVKYEGLTESMAIEGVKIHLYGKKITKPFRKMGHITVLSGSQEEALKKASSVHQLIKVTAWKEK
ncbi:MAG: 5-(carboxyamino)imidazole ribonucleotide synthase [Bacteroidales bacterium]|nr:5-(carboxyamino)imidazole ribonucleotide synthase [Bacteroidales bacterium]